MKFFNLNIGARLWTGFGAISVLMVLVVATGIVKMNAIEAGVDNLVRASRNEMLAMQIHDGINQARPAARGKVPGRRMQRRPHSSVGSVGRCHLGRRDRLAAIADLDVPGHIRTVHRGSSWD